MTRKQDKTRQDLAEKITRDLAVLREAAEQAAASDPQYAGLSPQDVLSSFIHRTMMTEMVESGKAHTLFPDFQVTGAYDFRTEALLSLGMPEINYVQANFLFAEVIYDSKRLWEYIDSINTGEDSIGVLARQFNAPMDPESQTFLLALGQDLKRHSVLKLAREPNDQVLGQAKYQENLEALLQGICSPEGQTVIEEKIDRKPNHLRVRVISTDPANSWRGAIEAFVKLYPQTETVKARLEKALGHYLGFSLNPCIRELSRVTLPHHLKIENSTYHSALVMPYVGNMVTAEEALRDGLNRDDFLNASLQKLLHFHVAGLPSRGALSVMEAKLKESKDCPSISELLGEISLLREHYFEPDNSLKVYNYLEEVSTLFNPESKAAQMYCQVLHAPQILNANSFAYLSLVHGDFHTRNQLVSKEDIIFIDLEKVHIGAPQIDLAKILTYPGIDCSWKEQKRHILEYFQSRPLVQVGDLLGIPEEQLNYEGLFRLGYHAAVVRNTIKHLKHVISFREDYESKVGEVLQRDYGLIQVHATRIIHDTDAALRFVAAVKEEFR